VTRDLSLCVVAALMLNSCGARPTPSPAAGQDTRQAEAHDGAAKVRHRARHRSSGGTAEAGKFDFYVLSLSWSPGFCATAAGRNDPLQCGPGRRFAFVLHGLWPQYQQGGWPENCSTETADPSLIDSLLPIMPSAELVAHEWQKHGTCSGLSPKDYFEEAADAFHSIHVPPQYQAPLRQITVSPDQLHQDFVTANPKMGDQGIVVLCTRNGRYLEEVRFCLTQDLEGRPCNAEVLRDACRSDRVTMRPVS